MKKILVVEDVLAHQRYFKAMLEDKVILLQATTRQEAIRLFEANPDVDLIGMDACVPNPDALEYEKHRPNTRGLVREMRKTFKGPIVGISDGFNEVLAEVGCDPCCKKEHFPNEVIRLLGL